MTIKSTIFDYPPQSQEIVRIIDVYDVKQINRLIGKFIWFDQPEANSSWSPTWWCIISSNEQSAKKRKKQICHQFFFCFCSIWFLCLKQSQTVLSESLSWRKSTKTFTIEMILFFSLFCAEILRFRNYSILNSITVVSTLFHYSNHYVNHLLCERQKSWSSVKVAREAS